MNLEFLQKERLLYRLLLAFAIIAVAAALRIAGATLLGSLQFFLVTNLAVWRLLDSYARTASGLAACYLAGLPVFRNTVAGDALYAWVLFGGFAVAGRFVPVFRDPAPVGAS